MRITTSRGRSRRLRRRRRPAGAPAPWLPAPPILEIEDDGVDGEPTRLLDGARVGAGHVEHAAARSLRHGLLLGGLRRKLVAQFRLGNGDGWRSPGRSPDRPGHRGSTTAWVQAITAIDNSDRKVSRACHASACRPLRPEDDRGAEGRVGGVRRRARVCRARAFHGAAQKPGGNAARESDGRLCASRARCRPGSTRWRSW